MNIKSIATLIFVISSVISSNVKANLLDPLQNWTETGACCDNFVTPNSVNFTTTSISTLTDTLTTLNPGTKYHFSFDLSYYSTSTIPVANSFTAQFGNTVVLGLSSVISLSPITVFENFTASLDNETFTFSASVPDNGTSGITSYFSVSNASLTTVVPVPPSIWLFGTTLLGFLGLKRSKH
jgi:hypothetical protein